MQGDEDELFDESALSKMLWSTEFKSGIMWILKWIKSGVMFSRCLKVKISSTEIQR
jgi:hypothetical protein